MKKMGLFTAYMYNEVLKLRKDGPYEITETMEFYKQKNHPLLSFRLFLEEIEDNFYEHHTDHQCEALLKKNLMLQDMDYIFLFEDLNHDLSFFCKKNGIPYKPIHENKTPKARKIALRKFIDNNPDIQDKIRKVWEEDFVFYEKAKKIKETINKNYLAD